MDGCRPCRRAVGPPQDGGRAETAAGRASVERREVDGAVELDEPSRPRTRGSGAVIGRGRAVLEEERTRLRPVTSPRLAPDHAVIGREVENPTDHGELVGVGAARTRVDVLHEGGAPGGAVAPPQLPAVHAVVRGEVPAAAEGDGGPGRGRRRDGHAVGQADRSRTRAIRTPQLEPARVAGAEEDSTPRYSKRRKVRDSR